MDPRARAGCVHAITRNDPTYAAFMKNNTPVVARRNLPTGCSQRDDQENRDRRYRWILPPSASRDYSLLDTRKLAWPRSSLSLSLSLFRFDRRAGRDDTVTQSDRVEQKIRNDHATSITSTRTSRRIFQSVETRIKDSPDRFLIFHTWTAGRVSKSPMRHRYTFFFF